MKFAYADPNELMLGAAGEHLVCADLLTRGIRAFLTTQECPYDVAAEISGRLLRVQVRSSQRPRQYLQRGQTHIVGYIWYFRKGKGATRSYEPSDVDVIAFVALDTRQIAYVLHAEARQTFCIPVSGHKTKCRTFEQFPLTRILEGRL